MNAARSGVVGDLALDPLDMASVSEVTIGEIAARLAPGRSWAWLAAWPPDVFAATGAILADSGAYRCLVDPPAGTSWPPSHDIAGDVGWDAHVRRCGAEWAAAAGAAGSPPGDVARLVELVESASATSIRCLDDAGCWRTLSALMTLHAMADEASVGAGVEQLETPFLRRAAARLDESGSLSRLATDRVRILPKLRVPEAGITLRSLSHNLALDRSEVHVRWLVPPKPAACVDGAGPPSRVNLLLVPYPANVHASDFRPVRGPLANMNEHEYGFYEYAPADSISPVEVAALARSARRRLGTLDAVLLPEGALEEHAVAELQRVLAEEQVPYLVAGVRRPAIGGDHFGANYAYIGGADWSATQPKHHRWCLDGSQVHQYHLGSALDPGVRWWEAIEIQRRTLTFITMPNCAGLTVCPLVCEDLARPDPVTDVVRAVAPTLVVALLLDGPQLASRWPARYASVLADDPGCSVLTLTALGMAWRSQPPRTSPSRVVALWKDPHHGLQQIELADGARAVALTAHRREVKATSADGRRSARPISELVLSGLEQIE